MRALLLALVVACSGEDETTTSPETKPETPVAAKKKLDPDVPVVAKGSLVASLKSLPHPSAILWVEDGKIFLGHTGPKWRGELPKQRDVVALGAIERSILEAMVKDGGPGAKEAKFALKYGIPAVTQDPDDKNDTDAHAAGVDVTASYGFKASQGTARTAGRSKTVDLAPVPILESTAPVVVANASVPAGSVAQVLVKTGGALAVRHRDELRILGTGFQPTSHDAASWLEVHLDPKGLFVLEPGGDARDVEPDELRKAIEKLARGEDLPVDLLVASSGVTVQQLVDVLAELGKARRVSLGILDGTSEARVTKLKQQIAVMGDLDKPTIRRYVAEVMPKVRACYDQGLTKNPLLAGTVVAQFFIAPDGSVSTSTATGVDSKVASCIANAIKSITFPMPKGGGGVQVNYPFVLQQER
jgi:hypothetical protein